MAKLLIEHIDEPLKCIVEGEGDLKRHFLSGTFMQAGIPNRNHRIYPVEILANEANRFTTEHIKSNRAYGELNHPTGPNINLDRVAIHIKNLSQEGNNFIGKALIASTPMGDIVRGLIRDDSSLGVSSRALGSLKPMKENLSMVQEDLRLLAIDVVADPSAPEAYVSAVMENRDWVYDAVTNSWTEQVVETHKKVIQKYTTQQLDEARLYMFKQFLDSIR